MKKQSSPVYRVGLNCNHLIRMNFPRWLNLHGEDFYEVKAKDFRRLIHRTLYATDTESTRYALGGILLEMMEDSVIGVGTDGRRLAKMEVLAENDRQTQ
jgi:DNA polymerase III subunit beta